MISYEHVARTILAAPDWDACKDEVDWLVENELPNLDFESRDWETEIEDWCCDIIGIDKDAGWAVSRLIQATQRPEKLQSSREAEDVLRRYIRKYGILSSMVKLTPENIFEIWNRIVY